MNKRVLVIDDDESIVFVVKEILEDMGHSVRGVSQPRKAVDAAIEEDYDLIILDLRMPNVNGADITDQILSQKPSAKILINTGYPGDPLVQTALERGAIGMLRKPFEIEKLYDYLGKE